ncbi:SRPBCC domain-containing protein [Croceimicrobium hydrocarbonivorans]|uniref:SRPBCC domain-containing protein n=1 Tax=Croceimicrobium hydrocarbonivorans TaxID=2761580 RepID=A0A7H0VDT8_9FLAO|nr:SRPBCC domain-containing protein [Croceimicrobium hydrocarbonivorans]QNR23886.1 SRPBCC domain-containing protein [Croceimicrobium hydrocarbonivorans]
MKESVELRMIFPVGVEELFDSWLDGPRHTAMTGSPATASDEPGFEFRAWEDYIRGRNLEIVPYRKIVQSWRTTDFYPEDEDSRVELYFKSVEGGTELHLLHTHIPEGQTQYLQGWQEFYFKPMQAYFSERKK